MRYWWVNQNQTFRHEIGGWYDARNEACAFGLLAEALQRRQHPAGKDIVAHKVAAGAITGKQFVLDAIGEGLLINCTHDTVLRFLPPYITTEKEVDQAVKIVGKLLAKLK